MIFGALGGLLIAIAYTLVTGKLQLSKQRIVYGTPARIVAGLALLPLLGLLVFVAVTGNTTMKPAGLGRWSGQSSLASS